MKTRRQILFKSKMNKIHKKKKIKYNQITKVKKIKYDKKDDINR